MGRLRRLAAVERSAGSVFLEEVRIANEDLFDDKLLADLQCLVKRVWLRPKYSLKQGDMCRVSTRRKCVSGIWGWLSRLQGKRMVRPPNA
jgi:hypothetical protein